MPFVSPVLIRCKILFFLFRLTAKYKGFIQAVANNGRRARSGGFRFRTDSWWCGLVANSVLQITGISGFVGFRILVEALQRGYRVRGVIRKESQTATIKAAPSIQAHLQNLELVVIPDLTKEGAYDNVLGDVTYIIHTASAVPAFGNEVPTPSFFSSAFKPSPIHLSEHRSATKKPGRP